MLRRGLAAVLSWAALAGVMAAAGASAACLPGRAWLLRAALLWQDPAAAVAVSWPQQPTGEAAPARSAAAQALPAASPSPQAAQEAQDAPAAAEETAPSPTPLPSAAPKLENPGTIRAEQFGQGSGEGYVTLAAGSIKNMTGCTDADLRAAVTTESLPFTVELDSDEPQVLILHTHATETYQTWPDLVFDRDFTARTQNTALNMCAVGEKMAEVLNAAGVNTLHDTTLHDSPSYTESYDRSHATVQAYLEKYPSIKVVLDVHRDAIEDADGTRVKPVSEIDGEATAQVMIIAGCDNGSSIRLPNWRLNLRFAAAWEEAMESRFPGLTRPVMCAYRYYNQDLSTGSLLIEVGGHANTLQEAVRAGAYAAEALAALFGAA